MFFGFWYLFGISSILSDFSKKHNLILTKAGIRGRACRSMKGFKRLFSKRLEIAWEELGNVEYDSYVTADSRTCRADHILLLESHAGEGKYKKHRLEYASDFGRQDIGTGQTL